jgi:hypothetical protein
MTRTKNLVATVLLTITATLSMATDITVVNTGSKTGGIFVESQAIVNELTNTNKYKVDFISPGNSCVGMGQVKKTKQPVLFFWETVYEVAGRGSNNSDCQIDFRAQDVVRVDTNDWRICTLIGGPSQADFIKSGASYKVGHANPASILKNNITAINNTFKTNHTGVLYTTGGGSTETAMMNKEIDFAIMSPKQAKGAIAQGAVCHWSMNTKEINGIPSLYQKANSSNQGLIGVFQTIFVAQNFDSATKQQVINLLRNNFNTPGAVLNNMYKGLDISQWDKSPSDIKKDWDLAIVVNTAPK